MRINELRVAWDSPHASIAPTYVNVNLGHSSRIDHFIVDPRTFDAIEGHRVVADPLNFSPHALLILDLNITEDRENSSPQSRHINKKRGWVKAGAEAKANYRECLALLIENLDVNVDALECRDLRCESTDHRNALNALCESIIESCLLAEQTCIVQPSGRKGLRCQDGMLSCAR